MALARAVVIRPDVLLLDEPLAALDLKLREELQVEIKRIQSALNITTLFVTHDQGEALSMSDRVAVMHDGRIVQIDCPEISMNAPEQPLRRQFRRPHQSAQYRGSRPEKLDGGMVRVETCSGASKASLIAAADLNMNLAPVACSVRGRSIFISAAAAPIPCRPRYAAPPTSAASAMSTPKDRTARVLPCSRRAGEPTPGSRRDCRHQLAPGIVLSSSSSGRGSKATNCRKAVF